ncbi:MAG: hypothetical protein Crog4KO_01990 [Crocinitomicaceae bacterium]
MDENDSFEDFDILDKEVGATQTTKLPSSLLALCILTFVGCAFILVKDLITFQFFEGDPDLPLVYILEVLSCFGSIAGAILMMRLKVVGFYIYLVSNIVYMLAVLWYWFGIMDVPFNEWMLVIAIVYIAAPVGFIIFYSTHKKYLH